VQRKPLGLFGRVYAVTNTAVLGQTCGMADESGSGDLDFVDPISDELFRDIAQSEA
jgi:hypothetical protein